MRRDAWSHPHSELFDEWAKTGKCPYQSNIYIERMHFFQQKKELWKPGAPILKDSDLIIAICKEKNWKIKY
jgi:hypothetical protein